MLSNTNSDCDFCSTFSVLEAATGVTLRDLTIIRTKNFIVLPDIAPLIEGHILIIPTRHCLCIGESNDADFKEFLSIKAELEDRLTKVSSEVIFFEHGASKCSRVAGACIDHAHVHCIPANLDITAHIKELPCESISSMHELRALARENIPYLFVQLPNKDLFVYKIATPLYVLSQYLRWVTANALGISTWNWREIAAPENHAIYETVFVPRILNTIRTLRKTTNTPN